MLSSLIGILWGNKSGPNPFTENFWLALRPETSVMDNGFDQCKIWTDKTLKLLKIKLPWNIRRQFHFEGTHALPYLSERGLGSHHWLMAKKSGRYYIADGTAGQLHPNYPQGFYGWLDEAPPDLMELYTKSYY
ncbi:hypothetical protein HYV81_00620 [Candidatus Woesearchaeota archaeon]|nr:hypothetical protein [Candidatus Woesearchaeota archaeon]